MLSRISLTVIIILFAAFLSAACFSAAIDIPPENLLAVISGETKTVTLKNTADRIDVGTAGIVSLFLPDKKSLAIKGTAPGFTTILIRYSDGTLEQYGITVTEETPQYIQTLAEQLKKELEPVKGITVKVEGSKIVLDGTIRNQTESEFFRRIVAMYAEFVLDLTGTYIPVAAAEEGERTDVVQIDVQVVQIRDTDDTTLGVKWFAQGPWQVSANYGVDLDTEKGRNTTKTRNWSDGKLTETTKVKTNSFDRAIKYSSGISLDKVSFELMALAEEGKARFLATPKLIVQSGKSASFLVGGEIPIAQATGLVADVEWKQYGTTLKIKPLVLKDGRIFINLNANISELDWSHKVGNYPSLISKEAETSLTARDGETFAIAGLISQELTDNVSKVPLLGDIPLIGLLFRSRDKEIINTETIVLFTPHILRTNDQAAIKPTQELEKQLAVLNAMQDK